ncbi:hypothetical protein D7X55_06780 [Corallococcus sp. AB049A]|uniref:Fibronectin type III domain-containing protein n=1 Tax=Corallococcus interemptor TaxID=2316720 RepID=A0A3A8Q1V9_9BACT|nr:MULTISPECIES: MXAN_2561 family MXYO-CTERM-anchored protein [Corallococcus]RKH52205.1 hypothetical protein D7Y23_07385 [Corallococcus sp. AB050B]RKH62653.1 hypothetical protein D7X96_29360 [Corallococcus interemptor]RKI72756.1 hypothetical protein D7X55_06780 [Corallococcus sp. AB049A]
MRLPFIGLLLFASTAVAQTGPQVTFTSSSTATNNTVTVPKSECGQPRRFNWQRTGSSCEDPLYIYVTQGTCGTRPAATDLVLETLDPSSSVLNGAVSFSVAQVLAARGTGADAGTAATCDTQDTEISFKLCASARRVGGSLGLDCQETFSNVGVPPYVVKFDPQPPATPSIGKVIARDSALSVQVDGAESNSTVIVEVAMVATAGSDAGTDTDAGTDADAGSDVDAGMDLDAGTDDGGAGLVGSLALEGTAGPVTRVDKASGEGNVVITGLTNGVTYRLQAIIRDAAGNESPASASVDATPVKSNGLFDAYVEGGGEERGGCAATGGGIAGGAVLAALGIWLSSRRKVS